MTWQCALTVQKAICALGCIKSSVGNRSREGILPLCSILVRAHLEFCIWLWSSQHREEMDLLKWVQRKATKRSERCNTSSEQPGLVEGVPAHGRGVGTR